MIEQIARYPRIRDRAVFVGDPDDIVPEQFGPQLPAIRDWTEQHYSFAGYVTGFDPAAFADRAALRAELGYRPDERVCIVTVGGSGVGGDLLRRVIASFPEAKRLVPELRMVAVAGPRIAPESLPACDGLDVRAYVPDLYRHLAACDLAVVQGGLTTAMELTANHARSSTSRSSTTSSRTSTSTTDSPATALGGAWTSISHPLMRSRRPSHQSSGAPSITAPCRPMEQLAQRH